MPVTYLSPTSKKCVVSFGDLASRLTYSYENRTICLEFIFIVKPMKPKLILFLDIDNRILSPVAEVVFRSKLESTGTKGVTIVSAGAICEGFVSRDKQMNAILAETGLHMGGIFTPLSMCLLEFADWVVCMDDESRNCCQFQKLSDTNKRISDFPGMETLAGLLNQSALDYAKIYEVISYGCEKLLHDINP